MPLLPNGNNGNGSVFMKKVFSYFRRKLSDKRGGIDQFIAAPIVMLVIMILFVAVVNVINVFIQGERVNTVCDRYSDYISAKGIVNAATEDFLVDLADAYGLENYRVSYAGTGFAGGGSSGEIPLENDVSVAIEYDITLGLGGMIDIPYTITARGFGKSEGYYK